MIRNYWKVKKIDGYRKSLECLRVSESLIHYITEMIPLVVDEHGDHIYIIWTEEINEFSNNWYWCFSDDIKKQINKDRNNDYIYHGILNIKNLRKEKLKKLNECCVKD